MNQIILDFGSGNTCKNDPEYAKRMIDAVAAIDAHKHEVIIKWQLFSNEPPNVPLDHEVFRVAYNYAKEKGYRTTASVFDMRSLEFLLTFDIPFVKIACRPRLYWLIGEVPRRVPVWVSVADAEGRGVLVGTNSCSWLLCIPRYPALLFDYEQSAQIDDFNMKFVSDHTEGLGLWEKWHPDVWEKHFILEDDPTNPDCAGHAIKPDLLKEVIGA